MQAIGDCPPAYYKKRGGGMLKIPNPYYFWYHQRQQGDDMTGEVPDQNRITGEDLNKSLLSDSKNSINPINPETDSTPQKPTSESTKSPLLEKSKPNFVSDSVSPEDPQTPDDCFSNCGDLAMSENQPAVPVKNRDIENSDINALDSISATGKRRRSTPQAPVL